jgi:1-acyl-sn-glycerol-3-phosphate acyltransferase
MSGVDAVWRVGRMTITPAVYLTARMRVYGKENVPPSSGAVLAMNHFHWLDPAAFGAACPRTIHYMAKIEAHRVAGLGSLIRAFGTFAVRRGETDRDAVRHMRQVVRDGHLLGIFAEGSRQRNGVPGLVQPGAAMAAVQEGVPVIPAAIHGTEHWRPGNFKPVSIVWGPALDFDGLPRNGRGYREASDVIQAELMRLWKWLVTVHADGRPRSATPPVRS